MQIERNQDGSYTAFARITERQVTRSFVAEGNTAVSATLSLMAQSGGALSANGHWYFLAEEDEPAIAKVSPEGFDRIAITTKTMIEEIAT